VTGWFRGASASKAICVLLTCDLFHITACVTGSKVKDSLKPTLGGMTVEFPDNVYFLCGDKHSH
jgi:hypothetical protein